MPVLLHDVGHASLFKFSASAYLRVLPRINWGSVVKPQIFLETVDLTYNLQEKKSGIQILIESSLFKL